MVKKQSKTEVKKQIDFFFLDIKGKKPEEIKKIKRLAMSQNIPLREKRKLFCKKCLTPLLNPKIRIKNKTKVISCNECGHAAKIKLKN